MPLFMIRSSFGAILMQHCSHQTLNSGSETRTFDAFILAPDLAFPLGFSDSWILLRNCNRLDGGSPVHCRSGLASVVWTARLHLHFDRARKELVRGIFDMPHQDSAANRSWTIGKFALANHHRCSISGADPNATNAAYEHTSSDTGRQP